MRLRLTDQALVAVWLARRVADARERARAAAQPPPEGGDAWVPTVLDLLVGLASEPDGAAGRLMRERASAAARLADGAPADPGLTSLDAVLRRAAAQAAPRPPGTADLLAATLEEGGAVLAELLEAAGYEPEALRDRLRSAAGEAPAGGETFGLDPTGRTDAQLSGVASRVVAQVRAAGGGAVDLVLALVDAPDAEAAALLPHDPAELYAALWRLRKRGQAADGDRDWDRGLDHVVAAARAWRAGPRVTTVDLLRAAVLAGGSGPSTILGGDGAAGAAGGP